MNAYIEILRPGNALMGAIAIILVAIIDKSFTIPIIPNEADWYRYISLDS